MSVAVYNDPVRLNVAVLSIPDPDILKSTIPPSNVSVIVIVKSLAGVLPPMISPSIVIVSPML